MRTAAAIVIALLAAFISIAVRADDYNTRQAQRYTREAEYYQKRAESHRHEAQYYLKQAEKYQREAAYYTRKGDLDRAKDYTRRADRAMDDYCTQISRAEKADETAADYLRRAARALE